MVIGFIHKLTFIIIWNFDWRSTWILRSDFIGIPKQEMCVNRSWVGLLWLNSLDFSSYFVVVYVYRIDGLFDFSTYFVVVYVYRTAGLFDLRVRETYLKL